MINTSQLLSYVFVGGTTGIVYLGSTFVFVEVLTLKVTLASTIGTVVAICYNYLMNYHWTFSSDAPHGLVLAKFLAMCAISLLLNGLVMHFGQLVTGFHYMLIQFFAGIVMAFWNLLASYFWVYKKRVV